MPYMPLVMVAALFLVWYAVACYGTLHDVMLLHLIE